MSNLPSERQAGIELPGEGLAAGSPDEDRTSASPLKLERFARALAHGHEAVRQPGRQPTLTDYLKTYQNIFESANRYFRGASDHELALSYAAEWMLDNSYVIQQALRQIDKDMPSGYYRQLPKLIQGDWQGYPRVYALAREIILYENAQLDLDRVRRFVNAYEAITSLTMGELWALPVMLRLAILQSLALAVGRITQVLPEQEDRWPPVIDFLDSLSDDDVIANCFTSLRTLASEDWNDFFEGLSLVELILRRDPAQIYPGMDFDTRDRYRNAVEQLALATNISEQEVAREALRLAQGDLDRKGWLAEASPLSRGRRSATALISTQKNWDGFQTPPTAHVGYYLLGAGRAQLETSLHYRPAWPLQVSRWVMEHPTLVYIGSIAGLSGLLGGVLLAYAVSSGAALWQFILVALLVVVPVTNVAINLVNWAITVLVKPRVLPKMNFEKGIPPECRTLVVVPALITQLQDVQSLLQQLELHYLRNSDKNLAFALLTDLSDAPTEHMQEDDDLVQQTRDGIRLLNEKYGRESGPRFLLFHRKRRWNPREKVWMGWERKRGKLNELNQLILGGSDTSFVIKDEALGLLPQIRFVITLDADTILPSGNAARLVATLAHPLNRAIFDPASERVISGYTVLQPRTEVSPTSANKTLFTRAFSGDTGLDLYTRSVSDVYQDFFGEGIYVGKGIYDVAAFERSLAGRVPENALLSHDLFEGIHGRAALVSDIALVEDYPPNYLVHMSRLTRWVRGDWQLLPWLFPRVPSFDEKKIPNRLSLIDRWKLLDNMRRSLLSPVLLLLFISGWLLLPGSALVWTVLGLFALAVPLITAAVISARGLMKGSNFGRTIQPVRDNAVRWFLALAFLPYEAYLFTRAILTTLRRIFFSGRGLLRWTTAAESERRQGEVSNSEVVWRQMLASLVLMLVVGIMVGLVNRPALPLAIPLLVVWLFSPEIAYWLGLPIVRKPISPSEPQRRELRALARRTWLFFEQYVGPDDHWLPPDHFQEDPLGVVAHRTSPTNIGLNLLSVLGAYDMGYIGLLDLTSRLHATFDSMSQLERYRGHFLNWYDTRSLEPLNPRYVSTVDSGNLAASLISLAQGLWELENTSVGRQEKLQGLEDNLLLLLELLEELEQVEGHPDLRALRSHVIVMRDQAATVQDRPLAWLDSLQTLSGSLWEEMDRLLSALVEKHASALSAENLRQMRLLTMKLRQHLDNALREFEVLQPWVFSLRSAPEFFGQADCPPALQAAWQSLQETLPLAPRLNEMDVVTKDGRARLDELQAQLMLANQEDERVRRALDWCVQLSERLVSSNLAVKALQIGNQELARRAETYTREMDFSFLFDPEREVFHIGYNMVLGRLDNNYYDLLASEARIASLISIAKGDAPQSHWLHLGRPLTQVRGVRALLSWSATMFEYLMPVLWLRDYEGTLLHQSSVAAVDQQIAYGQQQGVPWGISESGYYRFDSNLYYQYRAFGVPGLGFKRGLADDLVITPYASLLALPIRPQAVLENIQALKEMGMLGPYGFYEAADFTTKRVSLGNKFEIVRSYMAHHQGMIFISLAQVFHPQRMVNRFHSNPRIQSVELLLQEQVPQNVPLDQPHADPTRATRPEQAKVVANPWRVPVHAVQPQVHYLSNGRYSLLINSAGGGYSTWSGIDLTRWRADKTLNHWGTWYYVQDLDALESAQGNGQAPQVPNLWSASYQPTGVAAESQDVYFNAHMAEFRRRDYDISTAMEITIAPEDDVEIRRFTLTNHSDRPRRLRLTSYGEVVLADRATDQRHPAFNKLFIESEYLPEIAGLLFRRRPRSQSEERVYLVHALVSEQGEINSAFESDRLRFLGRGQTARSPYALSPGGELTGTAGATLDPVMALSAEVELEPHTSSQVAFITAVADSRQQGLGLAQRFLTWHAVEQAFTQARSVAEIELRQLGLSTPQLENIQRLLSMLVYPDIALRSAPDVLAANTQGQPALWAYGISGDYPVLLVRIDGQEDLPLVHDLLQAHAFWRNRQLKIDLVIVNCQGMDYGQELQGQLHRLIGRMNSDAWLNQRGGIFLLLADQLGNAERLLLETVALAILDGKEGSLVEQLDVLDLRPPRLPAMEPVLFDAPDLEETPPVPRPADLRFDNGLGGFSPDGREYIIYLDKDQWTPAPWINVVANPEFGFLVTESGSGFTWALNSGENRLTPWSNDPVSDPPGEAIYLRDEETGRIWSPTPLPARDDAPYLVRHGAGYSTFEHHSQGLKQHLRMFVAPDAPVKIYHLRIENTLDRPRRITATYFAQWVLGVNREANQQYVTPEFDPETQALLASNAYNAEFGDRVAFAAANKPLHSLTADRTEFLGRMGSLSKPAAMARLGLAGDVEAGDDPCAALQLHIDLAPGEVEEVYFLLGQADNREKALNLVSAYQNYQQVEVAWDAVAELWDEVLGAVHVETPDPALDLLLNRWLLYQALACRIWGRSAFYQSSGAYGFRDQLQDVMGLVFSAPEIAREHLLRAARHQFTAGDVLHWWHPPSGRGVRKRITDNLLWLPFVTAHYVASTGDVAVLDEQIPFKEAPVLEPGETERYGHYATTEQSFSLYEHCRRALEKGHTTGRHGLPLMGGGDWNDGMNRVGIEGQGESVWLGWFLSATLKDFAGICLRRGDNSQADTYLKWAADLAQAIEENAWDGEWYLRAFYDDGAPLGSAQNQECQIDAIAQSWAILSESGDPQRARQAMQSVSQRLVRPEDRLILLFTPPFDKTPRDPGYIKGYLPGIRENGGQYTHAALWSIWAYARLGQGDYAGELLRMINPIYHADTPEKAAHYKVEPYVVAADVYGIPPHVGRGGWTWYTGSSTWMYRVGLEAILGLRLEEDTLLLDPCIPGSWPGFSLTYRKDGVEFCIQVENPQGVSRGVKQVTLDGVTIPDGRIPLGVDGRTHQVLVRMG